MPRPYYDDDTLICGTCNGSGEGMHEGCKCYACKGHGEVLNDRARDDAEDEEADRKYEEMRDRKMEGF